VAKVVDISIVAVESWVRRVGEGESECQARRLLAVVEQHNLSQIDNRGQISSEDLVDLQHACTEGRAISCAVRLQLRMG
jgi:hypothetical protein